MSTRAAGNAQILAGTAAALALLYFLRTVLVPFVIAFVLAVLVSALVRFMHRRWAAPPEWAVSTIAGLIVISISASGIFVLAQGAAQMVAQGPALLARLDELALGVGQSFHLSKPLHLAAMIGDVSLPRFAGYVLSAMQGLGSGLLLVVVYFGFMLAGRERFSSKIQAAAGSTQRATEIRSAVERIAGDIETYVWVQTITGTIITASACAVMFAVGLHNVLFWAVIFFLLTFIPNIGVTVGSIAPSLFALIQFPTAWQAITIFAVIQMIATIVGNFIYPRLQARTQNIDPVATLLSLSFWSLLWGLPGAFLAVPMTLMLMIVFAEFESTVWIAALLSNNGKPTQLRPGASLAKTKGSDV